MSKSIFISLNIIGLLMAPLIYIGDITVSQSGNSTLAAGSEMEVTINISKEGVAGPARLKLDLTNAQGIEIEEIETEGASFSFNESNALFIWYSIQPSSTITLKYLIIADEDATGSKTITGSFSYLDEDERKTTDIQSFTFEINGDGTATASADPIILEGEEETPEAEAVSTNGMDDTTSNDEENEDVATNNESEDTDSNESKPANEEEPVNVTSEEENAEEETVEEITPTEEEDTTPVEEESTPEIEEETAEIEETTEEAVENTPAVSTENVSCKRTVEKDGNSYIVSLRINKGNNGGFARIKENIPAGFTAEEIETAGAFFKFTDNTAKFLWSSINKNDNEVLVQYRLTPNAGTTGSYAIRGSFSAEFLVENDRPKKIRIETTMINVGGNEMLASNDTPTQNTQEEEEEEETTPSNESAANNTEEESIATTDQEESSPEVEEEQDNNTSMGTTTSSNGIKYRVQIIAAHNTVSKRYIKKAFGYSGAFNIDNHEGWVKYTTNGYSKYEAARDKRNTLNKYSFDGPFVTAYNNGDRITVQEALMISNQSWMQ